MPSFSSPSSIRVASQDHVLRLKITHNLVHGSPSDIVHHVKGRLPKELDVLWLSDISISLSGSLNGHEIPADDIASSGLVHHLRTQLKANADRLGLNNVSRPFVDDADGLSKLTLTPSRPLPEASRPHANLVSLHLAYIWRTVVGCSDITDCNRLVEEISPFSPTLFLPTEALLHRVTEQFLVYHLVSRYPLIFGPWCKRFDIEMQHFPSIARSIVEIMTRSEDHRFISKCKRLLKVARRQHKFVLQTATAALTSCTDATTSESSEEETNEPPVMPALTDEQVLCENLEQLFRIGVPQRRFKPAAKTMSEFRPLRQVDDDLLQCTMDVGFEDEASWVELPEIATSRCTFAVADFYQTFPEDMDVFAQEDWCEDGMWRVHEADSGLGERELGAQSVGSLINCTISLANITTRSPQADPVALYHHLDVDSHGELDPAARGLGYKVSQLAYTEDAGSSTVFARPTRLPSHAPHDRHCLEGGEQVTEYLGTCQVESEGFEILDGWSDVDEGEDSDMMLFELDVPDSAEVAGFDEPLV